MMFSGYPDKENACIGKPVIKGSDVIRVRKNLAMPFRQRNSMDANPLAPSLFMRSSVNSPVTELANNFTELAAHENTPKRRLSMASSSGSPTPDLDRIKSVLNMSSESTSSSNSDSTRKLFGSAAKENLEKRFELHPFNKPRKHSRSTNPIRRFNSMPYGHNTSQSSPMLSKSNISDSPLTAPSPKRTVGFFIGGDENSHDDQDSGLGKEEGFRFVAPIVPPEKAREYNELSPEHAGRRMSIIGSPDFHDYAAQDSPVALQPCPDEFLDDGFSDLLEDLEKQAECEVPDTIAPMLTGKFSAKADLSFGAKTDLSFRGQLFKSPSVPSHLAKNENNKFDIRKRILSKNKRSDPDNMTPVAANKKRRGVVSDGDMRPVLAESPQSTAARLQRCKSMVEHRMNYELQKSESDGDLIGDMSSTCCIPTIPGKHRDLKCISPEIMAKIINKEYDDKLLNYTILDCRYPYEYEGGHINGAENIFNRDMLKERFLERLPTCPPHVCEKRNILIFHCEFSSERAPKLSRMLRNHDRDMNTEHYPSLYYPEIYLLEGGYKAFYESHKELCSPQTYRPMTHPDFTDDLKKFRAKSKSWAGAEKKQAFRTGLMKHW